MGDSEELCWEWTGVQVQPLLCDSAQVPGCPGPSFPSSKEGVIRPGLPAYLGGRGVFIQIRHDGWELL